MMDRLVFCLLLVLFAVQSFRVMYKSPTKLQSIVVTRMSDSPANGNGALEEALAQMRAKMAADPNYDPYQDPQAAEMIQKSMPPYITDVKNAVARLRVAFVDATTGPDAVDDINARSASVNKRELISAPNSKWIRDGMVSKTTQYDDAKREELIEKLKAKHPKVPFPGN